MKDMIICCFNRDVEYGLLLNRFLFLSGFDLQGLYEIKYNIFASFFKQHQAEDLCKIPFPRQPET